MILPRDWKAPNGKHFMQYVSHQKSERSDVVRLKEALDQALEHRQARTEGICPIREELFSEAFDEIIREVTIGSPERGVLLMRVRDEHKMTLAAYQTLYQSSVGFGVRKLL
jgi:dynein light intermediate chain